MTQPPPRPQIFHITHLDNLPRILAADGLLSDSRLIQSQESPRVIGMGEVKRRRFARSVPTHPGDVVADYVPFYFCPRSVMLYIIHKGNHPELQYRGGQGPIVHLVADLHAAVESADAAGRRWAFTTSNAGSAYSLFYSSLADLNRIDWAAQVATDFRDSAIRDAKFSEMLFHGEFPWEQITSVGVQSDEMASQVRQLLLGARHIPPVTVERRWYY